MKSAIKKIFLLVFTAIPLFSCNDKDEGKTYELKPTVGEISDKHQAVSTLGKAIKSSLKNQSLSILMESSKDLTISSKEDIHNSVENVDSHKTMMLVANGLSSDYRISNNEKLQMSLESQANQIHWEAETVDGKTVRNRAGAKLSGFIKDDTFYLDPSNKEFAGLVYDVADYLGFGDYRTVLMAILSQKYYLTRKDSEDLAISLGLDIDFDSLISSYGDLVSDSNIDSLIVTLDGKLDNWNWLTSYSESNGDVTFYASMDKNEFCALMEELDPPTPGEERESYAEVLTNVSFKSFEFTLTFAETGLKSINSLFAFDYNENNLPVKEEVTIPVPGTGGVPSDKQVGYKNVHTEISGGFRLTFGVNSPNSPSATGWSNIMTLLGSLN